MFKYYKLYILCEYYLHLDSLHNCWFFPNQNERRATIMSYMQSWATD